MTRRPQQRRGASRPEPRHSRVPALLILVLLALATLGGGLAWRALQANQAPPVAEGPNIVVVVLDDVDLATWKQLTDLAGALEGRVFTNAFSTNGASSASRIEMLTGQYAHNNGVLSDAAPIGGFARSVKNGAEKETVAVALHAAGYRTALVGEYLDGYGQPDAAREADVPTNYIPPGWDSWQALSGTYAYTGYAINADGVIVHPTDYLTDELASRAAAFLSDGNPAPHFLWLAPLAVRLPAEPAERDAKAKVDASVPTPANDVSDKPSFLQRPPVEKEKVRSRLQQSRLRTLLSVDDLVQRVLAAAPGNTVVILTSDGGYRLGSNGLHTGNGTAYEPDIRVPLAIQGPGALVKADSDPGLALNIDLAPTIAGLAGVDLRARADGIDLLAGDQPARDAFLIEHEATDAIPVYNALRTTDGWLYVEWADGTTELYDVGRDRDETKNLAAGRNAAASYGEQMTRLSATLHDLMDCAGYTCR